MATQSTTPIEPQPIETAPVTPPAKKPSALLVISVLALFAVIAGAGILFSNSRNTQMYNSAAKEKKTAPNKWPSVLPTVLPTQTKSNVETVDTDADTINKKLDDLDKENPDSVQNLLKDVTQFN